MTKRYHRGTYYPSICVKCYNYPDADDLVKHCSVMPHLAPRIAEWMYDDDQRDFLEYFGDYVAELFPGARCYQDGRSGGWLVVAGLDCAEVEEDAELAAKWCELENAVSSWLKHIGTADWWAEKREHIELNRWNEDGAEHYNFFDTKAGPVCLVDRKWAIA